MLKRTLPRPEPERDVYRLQRPVVGYQSLIPLDGPEPEPAPVFAVQPRCALTGQGRRDRGFNRVASRSPFLGDALRVAAGLLRVGATITGEDVRMMLEARGLRPHNSGGWGALISRLVRSGVLRETGRFVPGKRPAAHARRNAEYVVATLGPLGSGTSTTHRPPFDPEVQAREFLSYSAGAERELLGLLEEWAAAKRLTPDELEAVKDRLADELVTEAGGVL